MNALIAIAIVLTSLLPGSLFAAITRSPIDIDSLRNVTPGVDVSPLDLELSGDAFMRLREYTLTNSEQSTIGPNAARLLGLEVTASSIPTKNVSSVLPDGECYFVVSLKPNTDDIVLIEIRESAPLIMYLTNSKAELRVVLVNNPGRPYLIANDQAAAGFQALLEFWVEAAKTLPSSDLSAK